MKRVRVGPFWVADAGRSEVIRNCKVVQSTRTVIFALHVGGLNSRLNEEFVDAMNRADVVYADGAAIVALGKAAGARHLERASTTDIGIPVLREVRSQLGRTVRVAILGGPSGLAERAGLALEKQAPVEIVFTTHGYHEDYQSELEQLRASNPDVCIIGFGMPKEAIWVDAHKEYMPTGLIVTCGGWLGFLAGEEQRAPIWMQAVGLEWVYRLKQDFRRLLPRYARGLLSTLVTLPGQFFIRNVKQ